MVQVSALPQARSEASSTRSLTAQAARKVVEVLLAYPTADRLRSLDIFELQQPVRYAINMALGPGEFQEALTAPALAQSASPSQMRWRVAQAVGHIHDARHLSSAQQYDALRELWRLVQRSSSHTLRLQSRTRERAPNHPPPVDKAFLRDLEREVEQAMETLYKVKQIDLGPRQAPIKL